MDSLELLEEQTELIEERAEFLADMLNEAFLLESLWDDLKIKKEDLLDPNKIKSILDNIEKDQTSPGVKVKLLNGLYLFLLGLVGLASGVAVTILGSAVMNNATVFKLGVALTATLTPMLPLISVDRHDRLMDRINAAIKKLNKKIKKEKDPKNKKAFQDQLKALKQNLKMVQDNKKKRHIKSHEYSYVVVY